MSQYDQQAQSTSRRVRNSRWQGVLFLGLVEVAVLIAAQLTHHFNPKWMPIDSSSILEWTAFLVGFVALIIAIKTDAAVSQTLDGMNEALVGIETWAKAMTTRHVGPFPDHLEGISELISATRSAGTLDIIADCADYGSFYAPQSYKTLQAAMSDANSRNVKIQYVACGRLHRFTANSPYFDRKISDLTAKEKADFSEKLRCFLDLARSDEPFLDRLKSCLVNGAQMNLLVEWLTDNTDVQKDQVSWRTECMSLLKLFIDLNVSQLAEALLDSEPKLDLLLFVREWFNEGVLRCVAAVRRDPRMAPLFMWLRDAKTNAEAVFVLPSPVTRGFGFKTLDPILISSFSSTFDHYWRLPPANKN